MRKIREVLRLRLERVDEARLDHDIVQFEVEATRGPQTRHVPVVVQHDLIARDVHQDHLAVGAPSTCTSHVGANQVACGDPLPNAQRPETTKLSSMRQRGLVQPWTT